MIEVLRLILHIIASLFKPRTKLLAEILILRQQLNVLRRQVSKRPQLRNTDRFLFVWLYRWFPSVVCTENSDSNVLVMQAADEGMRYDASGALNRARDGRVLV